MFPASRNDDLVATIERVLNNPSERAVMMIATYNNFSVIKLEDLLTLEDFATNLPPLQAAIGKCMRDQRISSRFSAEPFPFITLKYPVFSNILDVRTKLEESVIRSKLSDLVGHSIFQINYNATRDRCQIIFPNSVDAIVVKRALGYYKMDDFLVKFYVKRDDDFETFQNQESLRNLINTPPDQIAYSQRNKISNSKFINNNNNANATFNDSTYNKDYSKIASLPPSDNYDKDTNSVAYIQRSLDNDYNNNDYNRYYSNNDISNESNTIVYKQKVKYNANNDVKNNSNNIAYKQKTYSNDNTDDNNYYQNRNYQNNYRGYHKSYKQRNYDYNNNHRNGYSKYYHNNEQNTYNKFVYSPNEGVSYKNNKSYYQQGNKSPRNNYEDNNQQNSRQNHYHKKNNLYNKRQPICKMYDRELTNLNNRPVVPA